MAEQSTHINYSFEDIQRYLQGKMSPAEMHSIEKAALQDAFLADAIEGFTEADAATAQKQLNEINTSLLSEKKKSKVVAFNKKTQWLSIASLIIIIAGIGVISFFVLNTANKQNEIAQLKKEIISDSSQMQTEDSGAAQRLSLQQPVQQNDVAVKKPEQKQSLQSLSKKEENYSASKDKNLQADDAGVTAMIAQPAPVYQEAEASKSFAAPLSKQTDSIQNVLDRKASGLRIAANTFSGKLVDQNGDPVPFAAIQLNNKQSIAADAEGKFRIQKNDSSLLVTISAVGFTGETAYIKPQLHNTIVLNRNNLAFNEAVITTALGTAKKSKTLTNTSMPVGGWQNFNNYVMTQLNKDTTSQDITNPNDLVEIEFLIDNNGNPYNFKITKPLDDEKNSKAIDILKSGPKWITSSKNKKARITISF